MKGENAASSILSTLWKALSDLVLLILVLIGGVSGGYFFIVHERVLQAPPVLIQTTQTSESKIVTTTTTSSPTAEETASANISEPVSAPEPPSITSWIPPVIRERLPAAIFTPPPPPLKHENGKPVQFFKNKLKGTSFYETVVDLNDSESFIAVGLANNAAMANTAELSHQDESFESFVRRYPAAVVANGTFFSKDDQKRVMGNMVSGGKVLKYSQWENFGTTLGLTEGNRPEMTAARLDGAKPEWLEQWFSLTCGPRLIFNSEIVIDAKKEGFADSHVLGIGPRTAMGYNSKTRKLYLITFLNGLSLQGEAELMREIGCTDAMNLDGGASRALAHDGAIVVPAQRPLTNVILIYDCRHKAPASLIASWDRYQHGERPQLPESGFHFGNFLH